MSPVTKDIDLKNKDTVEAFEPAKDVSPYPILQTMTEEDAYIHDRMKSQPKNLDEVLMVKEKKYHPGEHRLTLPKELKSYEDKFAFRWINKKKRAIDESITKGWVLCNRSLFPKLAQDAKHLFSTSGAIERGDCILSFMNKDVAMQIRKAPGERSSAYIRAQLEKGTEPLPKGQSGFYKPMDAGEKEDAGIGAGGGLQEGRDF